MDASSKHDKPNWCLMDELPPDEFERKFRATRAVPVFSGTSELAFIAAREIFTVPTSLRSRERT
jgi:hypothetical protein